MLNLGDKVTIRNGGILFSGVVCDVYSFAEDPIYIIEVNGEKFKRRESELKTIAEKEPDPTPDEITITREEFIRKFTEAITSEVVTEEDPSVSIALTVSGIIIEKKLEKMFFGKK